MADTIRVLSRVACTFRDTEGNVLYTVGPRDKFVIREAPAAIRNDPLFGWLQADGSIEVVSANVARRLENDPAAGTDAAGKRPAAKTAKA